MAENGFTSGDPRVDAALERLRKNHEARFKDLEDALLVHAHLEASAARRIKEHAEYLVSHSQWLASHEAAMKRHDIKMAEIDDKLNGLIGYMEGRQGE